MCQLRALNRSSIGHNFGSCNITEFVSQTYFANIFHTCGSKPTECNVGCRLYVNRMYDHICMKNMHRMILKKLRDKSQDAYDRVLKAKELCDATAPYPSVQTKLASSTVFGFSVALFSIILLN